MRARTPAHLQMRMHKHTRHEQGREHKEASETRATLVPETVCISVVETELV